jgi:hypothetical protein
MYDNLDCTSQETYYISAKNDYWINTPREIIAIYDENRIKKNHTLWIKYGVLLR